jgi:hypothetical protein
MGLVSPHVVRTTIGEEVVKELMTITSSETITSLVDLGVPGRAGLTELLDTILEEVLVGTLVVVSTESLLEIRPLSKVELEVKDFRAGTALLDTILMPVMVELAIVVMESVLEVRILVVIEISIEDNFLQVSGKRRVGNSGEAHVCHQALRITLVLEVPEGLTRSEVVEPWVASSVNLRVVLRAGLTELVDTILEEVMVNLGVVSTEGLLKIRVLAEVVLKVEDRGACTTLLDTILMPMVMELAIVMVESILEIRILVVIEVCIEDNIFHVAHGSISWYHIQHHFRKRFSINIKDLIGKSRLIQ